MACSGGECTVAWHLTVALSGGWVGFVVIGTLFLDFATAEVCKEIFAPWRTIEAISTHSWFSVCCFFR